ncbi:MAG TPA: hypothetical protein VEX86_08125 [Longimicrobium sp.]|nr:hypothetical protein [Longimicrobium sp.]
MRPLSLLARLVPLAAAASVAACSGGGTPPEPRLTPAQVAGVYNVCSLQFQPTQAALPAANLLATVINPSPPAPKQAPSLTLSGSVAGYQLLYTRRSDNFTQDLRNPLALGTEDIVLSVPDEAASEARSELLLPGQFRLRFSDNPRTLTARPEFFYTVTRANYARAAGISEDGLAERITGVISGVFTVGSCA